MSCWPGSLVAWMQNPNPSVLKPLFVGLGSRAAFLTFANHIPSSPSPHATPNRNPAQLHHPLISWYQLLKITTANSPATCHKARWQVVVQVALRPNAQLQPLVRRSLYPPSFNLHTCSAPATLQLCLQILDLHSNVHSNYHQPDSNSPSIVLM